MAALVACSEEAGIFFFILALKWPEGRSAPCVYVMPCDETALQILDTGAAGVHQRAAPYVWRGHIARERATRFRVAHAV